MLNHHTIIVVIRYTCIIASVMFCCIAESNGQGNLKLLFKDELNKEQLEASSKEKFIDSLEVYNYLRKEILQLRNRGYLSSAIDKVFERDSSWVAEVFIGEKYSLGKLQVTDVEQVILNEADYRLLELENKVLTVDLVSSALNKLVKALSNNGYPFASTQLKNTTINDSGEMSGELSIKKGKLILIDSLNIYGGAVISTNYLEKFLEINRGDRYDESQILGIKSKIKQLPFIDIKKNPTVTFFNDEAVINLNLQNKNASRFDFIIGLLQNENSQSDRFAFIYDFSAEMQNKLGAGEQIFIQFKRLQPEVQELDMKFNYPYLLDLPFGIDMEFSLYRNSTKNIDLDTDIGIQYFLGGNNYIKASWDYYSSNLLDIDTTNILRSGKLPTRLDISYNALGLSANIETLDYRYNPRKGISMNINTSIGVKRINENQEIKNLKSELYDFSNAYDSINTSGLQLNFASKLSYYLPIGNRSTLKTELQSGLKVAGQGLYQNEQYRLGGSKQLRGFDEQTIFSDFYNIATLEYRLLLGENSYLSAFADYGFVRNELLGNNKWDNPIGIGAGLNFETGAGVFGISTAVGKTREMPLNLRNAKIHFGYISVF